MVERRIMLKLGELVTVEAVPNGVFVSVRGVHQATAESEADCFDTLAARFRTLAVELEHMATANRTTT